MTKKVPNDRIERMEFLRNLSKLRNEVNNENVKVKQRKLEKQYLAVQRLSEERKLHYIDIPTVMHTEEHGDLVFRIDKESGTIKILKKIYKWDSQKDNIDDE